MAKKKLIRFDENVTFDHLFQLSYDELMKGFLLTGKWRRDYFKNDHPVILELGCGKGEYTVGLAQRYPEKNFIGVDIKGARMWRGCKTVQEKELKNVAFIRTKIELIEYYFEKDEVNEIWITFPDPQPKKINEKKRLSSPQFLKRYGKIMKEGGIIHLKTDNSQLFEYTLEIIQEHRLELVCQTHDLYASDHKGPAGDIFTFYEEMFRDKGQKIKYLQFKWKCLNA